MSAWSERYCAVCGLDRGGCLGEHEHAMGVPPDPEALNDARAMWAEAGLRAFADETGLEIEGDGWALAIADLVADLRHLGDRHDVSWDTVLDRVDNHYSEETRS